MRPHDVGQVQVLGRVEEEPGEVLHHVHEAMEGGPVPGVLARLRRVEQLVPARFLVFIRPNLSLCSYISGQGAARTAVARTGGPSRRMQRAPSRGSARRPRPRRRGRTPAPRHSATARQPRRPGLRAYASRCRFSLHTTTAARGAQGSIGTFSSNHGQRGGSLAHAPSASANAGPATQHAARKGRPVPSFQSPVRSARGKEIAFAASRPAQSASAPSPSGASNSALSER